MSQIAYNGPLDHYDDHQILKDVDFKLDIKVAAKYVTNHFLDLNDTLGTDRFQHINNSFWRLLSKFLNLS